MRQLRWSAALVAVVVASGLTACSEEERPSIPPVAFGPSVTLAPAPELPEGVSRNQRQLPVLLNQNTAYIGGPADVKIVDARSGQASDTVRPSNPVYQSGGPVGGAPVAATVNGSPVVVWPFLVTVAAPPLVTPSPTSAPGAPPPSAGEDASEPSSTSPPSSGSATGGGSASNQPSSSEPTSGAAAPPSSADAAPPLFGGTVQEPSSTAVAPAPGSDSTDAAQPGDPSAPRPPSGNLVELATIRVDNHTATTVLVALPGWASAATSTLAVSTIGVDGTTVLLGVTSGLAHAALAVDAVSGQTLWTKDNFAVGALVGKTAIGVESDSALGAGVHVTGVDLTDGRERWRQLRGYGLHVSQAGPTLVAAVGQLASGPDRNTFQLLNGDTGAPVAKLPVPPIPTARCIYDEASVTVCYAPADQPEDRAAAAVDARTGKQLWALPDYNTSNEPAPLITAAWHGLVYATADGTQTSVFRATNRAPMRTTPGAAPGVVADRSGIAVDGANIVARQPVV